MREKYFLLIMGIMLSLLLAACGSDAGSEEAEEEQETEVEAETDTEEAEETDEAEEEASAIPEDEELFAVLERNIATMDDLPAHMETIHSESPGYAETEQIIEDLSEYELDIDITEMEVEDKSEEEARVFYKQTNVSSGGPVYENNEITGVHILRPEDGTWKIYDSEISDYVALDENGIPIEEGAIEEAVLEGEYADAVAGLEMPFIENEWVLIHYAEEMGEAIAEYIVAGEENAEDFSELLTVHYFPEGKDDIGVAQFIDVMEMNLTDMLEGDFEFNRFDETEEEGLFEFTVENDPVQFDQEELARVFVKNNDLFAVRYTLIEDTVEDRDAWIDTLSNIQ